MPSYPPLDWGKLATYASTPFPPGWSGNEWVLFSPRDSGVHQAIMDVVASASHRVLGNHYGFDDDTISDLMLEKAADPNIFFLLNLDKSQAGGVHEKKILANWKQYEGTMVAIGDSIHNAISHLKVTVVDGLYVISGSTNLSMSGETLQDNELRITRDPLLAARYESILLLNHAHMLSTMSTVNTPVTG
jgi:phosphatidylserine/phosphatidylglycerophosphate/cardiolipin synthase-like enzyme